MTFREFAEKAIQLIHEQRQHDEYLDEIDRLFRTYLDLLENVDDSELKFSSGKPRNEVDDAVKMACEIVFTIAREYYNGRTHLAQLAVNSIIFGAESIFSVLVTSSRLNVKSGTILYRARTKFTGVPFYKKELSHIPFRLRHLVQNMRYSISGLPALYFGSDSYTCWEELNRPEFSKTAFAGFKAKKDFELLDLRIPVLKDTYSEPDKSEFLTKLPLILAITRKVKYPDAPFKPEYIISQLLSRHTQEAIKGKKIPYPGIAFSSSKIDYRSNSALDYYNVFFPVRFANLDPSPIVDEYFEISYPIEWEVMEALSEGSVSSGSAQSFAKGKDLSIDGNQATDYNLTRWGLIDKEIESKF